MEPEDATMDSSPASSAASSPESSEESPSLTASSEMSSLARILDADDESVMDSLSITGGSVPVKAESLGQQLSLLGAHVEGMCMECEDQPATRKCKQCDDDFCRICFESQHRRGNRRSHTYSALGEEEQSDVAELDDEKEAGDVDVEMKEEKSDEESDEDEQSAPLTNSGNSQPGLLSKLIKSGIRYFYDPKDNDLRRSAGYVAMDADSLANFADRAKYIPVRLSLKERKRLRLLESILNVSEYTDRVDNTSFPNPAKRVYAQVLEVCGILSGIIVGLNYKAGQQLCKDRDFSPHADLFKRSLEIGRRHKIMNPEKMRSEYGKLMYLLQDTVLPEIQDLLEFSCKEPICTVYSVLEKHGAEALLSDPNIEIATRAITEYRMNGTKKDRSEVRKEVKDKEKAVEYISRKYANAKIGSDRIKTCLYSIGDNRSFLLASRDPVEKMIRYLTKYFSPDSIEEGLSLAINDGDSGTRITHSHERQYYYVLQSLTLWRDISNDMFKLWCLADEDLLSVDSNPYQLMDTGQGLNRVQQSPRVFKEMRRILHRVQEKVGGHWVGSSVIHLGDRNVPNALMFIDKYTQVPRILNPVIITLDRLSDLSASDDSVRFYLDEVFGGVDKIRKEILADFFRFAFDGSGADNFFEAGSCIDGRLTSAWNWCSNLPSKPFYPIFKLTGFLGFDGEFQT